MSAFNSQPAFSRPAVVWGLCRSQYIGFASNIHYKCYKCDKSYPTLQLSGLLHPWGQYVRTDTAGKMKGGAGEDGKSKEGR